MWKSNFSRFPNAGLEMPAQEAADLLLQAVNAAKAEQPGSPLAAAEQMTLRYFARANLFSRNEAALAEFQSISVSAATTLVASLDSRGYLIRVRAGGSGGKSHLDLTERAHALLANDPYEHLLRAINGLGSEEKMVLCQALRGVLGTLVENSAHWYLNSCRSCAELVPAEGAAGPHCKTFDIEIPAEDLSRLCINYNPRPQPGPSQEPQPHDSKP
jgi:DNA-binding MarR family transcriptional regulator